MDIIEITETELSFRGSGHVSYKFQGDEVVVIPVAFEFHMEPFHREPRVSCWSDELKRAERITAVDCVEFDGVSTSGRRLCGKGMVVGGSGISFGFESPRELVLGLREFEMPASDPRLEIDDREWQVPLYSILFNVENKEHKEVHYPKSLQEDDNPEPLVVTRPGYTEIEWGDWCLRFFRDAHFHGTGLWVSGTVALEGPRDATVTEAHDKVEILFDLLAPLSGVVGSPRLLQHSVSNALHWRYGGDTVLQWPAHLQYPDKGHLRIKPYLEKALSLHDSQDTESAAALRALARSLTVPVVPLEPCILAISMGIEIIREHFWQGRGTYFADSVREEVRQSLLQYAERVPKEYRDEFLEGLVGKANEIRRRPFRLVAAEVLDSFTRLQRGGGGINEFARLRNNLVHKGVIQDWPDPIKTVLDTRRYLAEAYEGVLGLWDGYEPEPPSF